METRLSPKLQRQTESSKTKALIHLQSFSREIIDYLRAVSKLSTFDFSIVQVFNAKPQHGQLFINLAGMDAKFAHIESSQPAYVNEDVIAYMHKFFRTWRTTDLMRAKKFIKKLFAPLLASKEWDAYIHDPFIWQHHPAFKANTLQAQLAAAFALKLVSVYQSQQPNVPEHAFTAFTQICDAMIQRQCVYATQVSDYLNGEFTKQLHGLNKVYAQALTTDIPQHVAKLKEHAAQMYKGKVKAKTFNRIFNHVLVGFCEKLIQHRIRLLVNAAIEGTYKLKHIENDVLHLSLAIDQLWLQNRIVPSSEYQTETLANYDVLMQTLRQELLANAFKQVIYDVQTKVLKEVKLPSLFEKIIDRVQRVMQTPAHHELFLLSLVRHVMQLQQVLNKQEIVAALAKLSLIAIKNTYQQGLAPLSLRPAIAAFVAQMDPRDKDLIRWKHQHALLFVGINTQQFFSHTQQHVNLPHAAEGMMHSGEPTHNVRKS